MTVGAAGHGRPCDNIDARAKGSGVRHKLSLSWQIDTGRMLYGTWSTGFRPGGINRRSDAAPDEAESLVNCEIGWKTSWLDNHPRINADVFLEDLTRAQFPVTSDQNGIEDIVNAGKARSKGIEAQIELLPARGLTLSASGAYVDARLAPISANMRCPAPTARCRARPAIPTRSPRPRIALPATPRFKMSATSRYEFPDGDGEAHVQAAVSHQSDVEATLTAADRPLLGRQSAYTTVDLAIGGERGSWSAELIANAFDEHGQAYHYPSCTISICGTESIQVVPITPRLINLRLGRRFR